MHTYERCTYIFRSRHYENCTNFPKEDGCEYYACTFKGDQVVPLHFTAVIDYESPALFTAKGESELLAVSAYFWSQKYALGSSIPEDLTNQDVTLFTKYYHIPRPLRH